MHIFQSIYNKNSLSRVNFCLNSVVFIHKYMKPDLFSFHHSLSYWTFSFIFTVLIKSMITNEKIHLRQIKHVNNICINSAIALRKLLLNFIIKGYFERIFWKDILKGSQTMNILTVLTMVWRHIGQTLIPVEQLEQQHTWPHTRNITSRWKVRHAS